MFAHRQQIVGGLLAYCFSLIPHGWVLESWQAIFIAYGVVSVLSGVFVIWWLPDSPMRAKCFSEEDKHLMVERVRANQTGLQKNKKFRVEQMEEVSVDMQSWCYYLAAFHTMLPTGDLGAFANLRPSSKDD
jgi:MFS family permease